MSEQETAVFCRKFTQFHMSNADSHTIIDGDTLDNDIHTILKKHHQSLSAKTGVIGLDIDFNGRPSILIFVVDKKQVTNLPNKLDGFPVEIIEGEPFFA